MVSFSQPQRINPYNNNSLSSQGGDYLRRVARSAPKADFRKGIGLGVPSAILGAPGDLSQLAASLPGQSIFDYAQMLNLLPPDKEKVKGYLEGLLNPQINDQEAYDTGSGLIADLLSPAAVLKGPQTVKRAIDYAAPLSPAEKISKKITGLLKSGRADEVTDEMLANADASYLSKKYDLPLDAESRMTRASAMGFDVDNPVYHGTHSKDIKAFDDKRIGDRDDGFYGSGHYFTPNSGEAKYYGPNVGEYNLKGNLLDLTDRVGDSTLGDPEYFKWWANELDKIDMLDEPTTKGLQTMRELDRYVDKNLSYVRFDNDDGTTGYLAQIVDPTKKPDVYKGKTYIDTIDTHIKTYADQQTPLTKEEAKQNAKRRFMNEMQFRSNNPFKGLDDILYSLSDYIRVGGKGAAELTKKASEAGYDGIKVGDETVIFKPKNIRSSKSRFDPRLQSLDNLNASVVMPAISPGIFTGILADKQVT
mgnify:CR=1 FL=1